MGTIRHLLVLLSLAAALPAFAQEAAPEAPPRPVCDAPEHRQFDFWLGRWNVTADGQEAGSNVVTKVHGGCVVLENWQGAGEGGLSGSSFNIYDRATGKWHQTWVDSSGTLLQLDGGLVNGAMVLSGSRPAADGTGPVLHRISWTLSADGSVRQLWEASRDGGANWTALFDGLYLRAAELQ